MNREIKFRCLTECIDEKEEIGFPKTKWVNFNLNFRKHIFPEYKQISPDLQFTGLKDKNGVDIYEGDVVKFQQDYIKPKAVYWNNEMTGFYPLISEKSIRLEVIGNIHENPELINK